MTATVFLPIVAYTAGQTVTIVSPQAQWSADFWAWLERTNNALLQEQGSVDCGLGQSGAVWFLAGSEGITPTVRTCTVPANTTLIVPVHTVSWNNVPPEDLTVPEKRAVLNAIYSDQEPGPLNTKICRVESSINGEAVESVRLQSPPFALLGDPEAVADGFWFAFSLSSGTHVVRFRGALCDFGSNAPVNDVDVTYTLRVDPEYGQGASWQLFVWNTDAGSQATGCAPEDPNGVVACDAVNLGRNSVFAGAPPWQYVAPATGAVLQVVDTANGGDEFEVFDNNQSIGSTSPSQESADCPVPAGGDPGLCLEREGISSGEFVLAPGAHSITIQPRNGFYIGVGYFRFEPTAQQ